MTKTICLYDGWNGRANFGEKHAIFTPHYIPEEHGDSAWDKGDHPDFEQCNNRFWEDIDHFDMSTKLDGFVILGELGLWNGPRTIYPAYRHTLKEALKACWGSCDDFRIDICDGTIRCYAWHHDGRNDFTVRGLGVSRMTPRQKEDFFADTGKLIDEKWIKTDRHLRKINLFKVLGINENRLNEAVSLVGAIAL